MVEHRGGQTKTATLYWPKEEGCLLRLLFRSATFCPLHFLSPLLSRCRPSPPFVTMDIDDILASVDRGDVSSPESAAFDHQLLTRFWVAERGVSELLPWPAPLMERVMNRVRRQVISVAPI